MTDENSHSSLAIFFYHICQTLNWDLPHGHLLQARCEDLGLYKLVGEAKVLCSNGLWAPKLPQCVPTTLLTNFSDDSPPSIRIKVGVGSAAYEPSGVLAVLPGSTLHLDCMYPRRKGSPEWTWTGWFRQYLTGESKRECCDDNFLTHMKIIFTQAGALCPRRKRHVIAYRSKMFRHRIRALIHALRRAVWQTASSSSWQVNGFFLSFFIISMLGLAALCKVFFFGGAFIFHRFRSHSGTVWGACRTQSAAIITSRGPEARSKSDLSLSNGLHSARNAKCYMSCIWWVSELVDDEKRRRFE